MSDEEIDPEVLDRRRAVATVLGTVGGLLAIVLVIAVMLYATRDTAPNDNAAREAKLAELRAADEKATTEYGWIDKSKGTVRLPIDVAIEKSLADGFKLPATQPASKPTKK